jgi:hypothetical protein
MKRTEAFASNYLNQDDLPHAHTAVIKTVGKEMVNTDDNGQREKPVIYFENGSKPLILNMVNWDTIETSYGPDSDAWVGKPIELFVDPNVMYGARRVGGIRIRIPATQHLTLEQALAAIADAGVTREELRAEIEKRGHKGYNAQRDTQLVRELIAAKVQHASIPADDIPF